MYICVQYQKSMELTEEHKIYLSNKHRGGVNNQKGKTFEDVYATKEIIRLYSLGYDLDKTFVCGQLENVFVDDFQIIYPDGLIAYHQCKNAATLSWNKDEKGEPYYDFRWQKYYSNEDGEYFRLKIVYSHAECAIHSDAIPPIIEDVTDKELFPAYSSLNAIIVASPDFRQSIEAVMFAGTDGYTYDKLAAFAEIIRSEWLELAEPNKTISLQDIKDDALTKYGEILNFKSLPDVELSYDLKLIFDRFPKLSYTINGTIVFWNYKRMSGQFTLSDDLISDIVKENPEEIFQLITLFN